MEEAKNKHLERTRTLRPVEETKFTENEMVAGVLSSVCPDDVISLNQLHGEKRGVVRISMISKEAAEQIDQQVLLKKLRVKGVRLAQVDDGADFVKVTLLDVPEYLTDSQVEKHMSYYGSVVNSKREYFEYQGIQIENETRHLFLENILRNFPSKLLVCGHEVFVSYRNPVKPTTEPVSEKKLHGTRLKKSFQQRDTQRQERRKKTPAEYDSSQNVSPARSVSPNDPVPKTHKTHYSRTTDKGKHPSPLASSKMSPEQNLVRRRKKSTDTLQEPVTKTVLDSNKRLSDLVRKSTSAVDHVPEARDAEKGAKQRAKQPENQHKLKRSDIMGERVASIRKREEKLALNKALESMCNPLHNFESGQFNITSTDGLSYGYGRLEVSQARMYEDKTGHKNTDIKTTQKLRRSSTTKEERRKSLLEFGDTRSESKERKSSIYSPSLPQKPDGQKNQKDQENMQSLHDVTSFSPKMSSNLKKSPTRSRKIPERTDFRSPSPPGCFSDPEISHREKEHTEDLVRSLTASPLSMTGVEHSINRDYFSSRQWFTSEKTGQLSDSVRRGLSESDGHRDEITSGEKTTLDEADISGTPYRHPDEVRCKDNILQMLFSPRKKKQVRMRDTRARALIKKQFAMFSP